jgi:hypothetical protein
VEVDAPAGRYRCRILTTGRYQTAAPPWTKTSPSQPRPTGWAAPTTTTNNLP